MFEILRRNSLAGKPTRLYFAFYPRPDQPISALTTHTALLLAPESPSGKSKDTVRFHVSIRPGEGWEYKCDEVQARTPQLAAAVFLGEVLPQVSAEDVAHVVEKVPIKQCDINWNCYDWVAGALKLLRDAGMIGLPTDDPLDIWRRGLQFCQETCEGAMKGRVPICDPLGNVLKFEF